MQNIFLIIGLLFVTISLNGCDSSRNVEDLQVYLSAEGYCKNHGGMDIITFYTKRNYVSAWCKDSKMIRLNKTGVRLK